MKKNTSNRMALLMAMCLSVTALAGCGAQDTKVTDGQTVDGEVADGMIDGSDATNEDDTGADSGSVAGADNEDTGDTGADTSGVDTDTTDASATGPDATDISSGADEGGASGMDSDDNTLQTEAAGNGTYFVRQGSKVYFHAPAKSSLDAVAVWTEYDGAYYGDTVLYAYDEETGKCEEVLEDGAHGTMAMSGNGLLYYNSYGVETDYYEDTIGLVRDDEMDESVTLAGTYGGQIYADQAGIYAAYLKAGDNGTNLCVFRNGVESNRINLGTHLRTPVGIAGDKFIYTVYDDDDSRRLMQVNMSNSETLELGQLPDFLSGSEEIDEFLYEDGSIYFAYSNYDGTGHFFQSGYWVYALLDEAKSIGYVEAQDDYETAYFYVSDGDMKRADGIPGTAATNDGEDSIGYYDARGKYVTVATGGYAYMMDDDDNITNYIEQASLVGNAIYAIIITAERVPEEDIGWRYAYRRTSAQYVRIDTRSGVETVLATVN